MNPTNPEQDSQLFAMRHSAEHVLMFAMKRLGYDFNMAMGPATNDGFYFDFELLDGSISDADFPKIEEMMNNIIAQDLPISREEIDVDAAKKLFSDNEYKQEWIKEASDRGETLSIYWVGEPNSPDSFVDLCAGPHVTSTGEVKAVKLLSVAGAYWRGDEHNTMLTRIYGTAFETEQQLENYVSQTEKLKQNDHRILGKKLDLFTFSELVGKGFVMYTPKGTVLINELKHALISISKQYGVEEVTIPHLAKIDLYKISGHAEKFAGELFKVVSHYDEEFVLKPVNCPHHTQIYASRPRSYRDLPIRYIESTQQHRDEKPGAIGGLNRTRSFEIDDGHTFCTPSQIKQEAINTVKIIQEFYESLGMWGNHWVSLSFRDPKTPEKYIGNVSDWEHAQHMLGEINDELHLNGVVMEGEAALYGPKIDFMLKDALGNDRQLGTVQIDFAMPERFNLTYTDADGQEKTPVMMHRAILGSYGRFIANLLESTGGAFPVWLSPTQVAIIPINDTVLDYAYTIKDELYLHNDIRVEIDDKGETMQNKIRNAQEQKVPYMLVIGPKEMENNTVNVRLRTEEKLGEMQLKDFVSRVKKIVIDRSLEL
ncbi:threonine--tRNA ligase [candidate division WWE3 bacterium CG_4_10_14_0_2_um_filter_41_14]|uniref:Threonine--tRNA ligase n=1 Tax=candidate division WWE3 bacterium CG_4_10_14_0_2_um_filter_41_14 TaxID=1975072 RepID=A0A2M7TK61_UNCKA|nr:MAG: threonine--tRNA ligase [candidate division WWE3 bacterium CG_4_10_14_0_2_um_filter_41_14]